MLAEHSGRACRGVSPFPQGKGHHLLSRFGCCRGVLVNGRLGATRRCERAQPLCGDGLRCLSRARVRGVLCRWQVEDSRSGRSEGSWPPWAVTMQWSVFREGMGTPARPSCGDGVPRWAHTPCATCVCSSMRMASRSSLPAVSGASAPRSRAPYRTSCARCPTTPGASTSSSSAAPTASPSLRASA